MTRLAAGGSDERTKSNGLAGRGSARDGREGGDSMQFEISFQTCTFTADSSDRWRFVASCWALECHRQDCESSDYKAVTFESLDLARTALSCTGPCEVQSLLERTGEEENEAVEEEAY